MLRVTAGHGIEYPLRGVGTAVGYYLQDGPRAARDVGGKAAEVMGLTSLVDPETYRTLFGKLIAPTGNGCMPAVRLGTSPAPTAAWSGSPKPIPRPAPTPSPKHTRRTRPRSLKPVPPPARADERICRRLLASRKCRILPRRLRIHESHDRLPKRLETSLTGVAGISDRLDVVNDAQTKEPASLVIAPRPPHPHDNWLEIIEAGAAGGFIGAFGNDVYIGVKSACRDAVKKLRDRRSGPDEQIVYMHQLIAESFLGPCPPGHKLVHLNGNGLDNRRKNLAYVPEADPRPAAPLGPPIPKWLTKPTALEPSQQVSGRTQPTGKRKRKRKKKHH